MMFWNLLQLEQICLSLQKIQKPRTKGAARAANTGPRGYQPPRGSEKQVANKTRHTQNIASNWLPNGNQHFILHVVLSASEDLNLILFLELVKPLTPAECPLIPYSGGRLRRLLQKAIHDAGAADVDDWTPHSFRANFATELWAKGVAPERSP